MSVFAMLKAFSAKVPFKGPAPVFPSVKTASQWDTSLVDEKVPSRFWKLVAINAKKKKVKKDIKQPIQVTPLAPKIEPTLDLSTLSTMEAIKKLVAFEVVTNPIVYRGHNWAVRTLEWYAEKLDVNKKTVERTLNKGVDEGIFVKRIRIDPYTGVRATFILLGDSKKIKSPEDYAREMLKYYIKETKSKKYDHAEKKGLIDTSKKKAAFDKKNQEHDKYVYGCLVGLATLWGDMSFPIFKCIIDKWDDFAKFLHLQIAYDKAESVENGTPKNFNHLKFYYPNIRLLRYFSKYAPDFYANNVNINPQQIGYKKTQKLGDFYNHVDNLVDTPPDPKEWESPIKAPIQHP